MLDLCPRRFGYCLDDLIFGLKMSIMTLRASEGGTCETAIIVAVAPDLCNRSHDRGCFYCVRVVVVLLLCRTGVLEKVLPRLAC